MRNRWFSLSVTALAVVLTGCAPKAAPPAPAPVIAGGWQVADPQGQEVQAAASFAAAHLPQGAGAVDAVTSAQTQVVAGTNLRMILHMADGARWSVTVWHRLDGGFDLTDAQKMP